MIRMNHNSYSATLIIKHACFIVVFSLTVLLSVKRGYVLLLYYIQEQNTVHLPYGLSEIELLNNI